MSQTRDRYLEITLLGLILVLGGILFYQAAPFINGILGAITLYILLRRVNIYLTWKLSEKFAPWLIVLAVTVFFLIPLSCLVWYVVDLLHVQAINLDLQAIIARMQNTLQKIEDHTGIDLVSEDTFKFITARLSSVAQMLVSGINNFAITLLTALLLLFFLLSGGIRMEMYIARLLPFNEQNKAAVITNVTRIVRSNAIGIPLLAILQGTIATLCYSFIGVPNSIQFGVLTGFASLIPIVGTMLVWIPLAVSQYFDGGLWPCVYVLACGLLIISQCDNVLRMIMQKRMANTHPLITIFGVIVGLPIFGFMGLIFGPLLVAMFLLFLNMFARQYILGEDVYEMKQANALSRNTRNNTSKQKTSTKASDSKVNATKSTLTPSLKIESSSKEQLKHESMPANLAKDKLATKNKLDAKEQHKTNKKSNVAKSSKKDFKSAKAEHKQQKREAARLLAEQTVSDSSVRPDLNLASSFASENSASKEPSSTNKSKSKSVANIAYDKLNPTFNAQNAIVDLTPVHYDVKNIEPLHQSSSLSNRERRNLEGMSIVSRAVSDALKPFNGSKFPELDRNFDSPAFAALSVMQEANQPFASNQDTVEQSNKITKANAKQSRAQERTSLDTSKTNNANLDETKSAYATEAQSQFNQPSEQAQSDASSQDQSHTAQEPLNASHDNEANTSLRSHKSKHTNLPPRRIRNKMLHEQKSQQAHELSEAKAHNLEPKAHDKREVKHASKAKERNDAKAKAQHKQNHDSKKNHELKNSTQRNNAKERSAQNERNQRPAKQHSRNESGARQLANEKSARYERKNSRNDKEQRNSSSKAQSKKRYVASGMTNNQGYEILRPERKRDFDNTPILQTVVSHQYGTVAARPKSTLRTQLISVHTARGTMMANQNASRKSGKRRSRH